MNIQCSINTNKTMTEIDHVQTIHAIEKLSVTELNDKLKKINAIVTIYVTTNSTVSEDSQDYLKSMCIDLLYRGLDMGLNIELLHRLSLIASCVKHGIFNEPAPNVLMEIWIKYTEVRILLFELENSGSLLPLQYSVLRRYVTELSEDCYDFEDDEGLRAIYHYAMNIVETISDYEPKVTIEEQALLKANDYERQAIFVISEIIENNSIEDIYDNDALQNILIKYLTVLGNSDYNSIVRFSAVTKLKLTGMDINEVIKV